MPYFLVSVRLLRVFDNDCVPIPTSVLILHEADWKLICRQGAKGGPMAFEGHNNFVNNVAVSFETDKEHGTLNILYCTTAIDALP